MKAGTALLLLLCGCVREPTRSSPASRPDAACLVLRTMSLPHCARGTTRCERCREAAHAEPKPTLLDLCTGGDEARPVVEIGQDGMSRFSFYRVVRVFDGPEEARRFGASAGVSFVDPEDGGAAGAADAELSPPSR